MEKNKLKEELFKIEWNGLIGIDTKVDKLYSLTADVAIAFYYWKIQDDIGFNPKSGYYISSNNDNKFYWDKELFTYFIENIYSPTQVK